MSLLSPYCLLSFLFFTPSTFPILPRVLRTCGVPLHKHPGLKEALLEMEKQGIASPFLFSTLANLVEGELGEGTADAAGSREKVLTVSAGIQADVYLHAEPISELHYHT